MPDLQASDFQQFFFELHGTSPFPWQESLAGKVCAEDWPEVIDLPTASGKTACIDIALFALALRGAEVPRRIFFVVDRRVVVNEAYLRIQQIECKLKNAGSGVLGAVAGKFRELSGDNDRDPLRVYEMRGGTFRDETWVKNPLQPTVIASTVDQVGSRLLFRGYGVSENSWPLHAGFIGNDALIFLDEAHCSAAFAQTLQRVQKYRGEHWAERPLETPFRFVEMTATPSREIAEPERFRITEADRKNRLFEKRLHAPKPTALVEVKGKKDDFGKLADELISQAMHLVGASGAKRVAILVNRVRTAKIVHERMRAKAKGATVELVIGRMRPVDRDDLYEYKLKKLKSGTLRHTDDPLTLVVSTQCLEVGADLDFDVLVSECASIDALQQRFGRLDRLGEFGRARGAIVIGSWQANPKEPDPIYGEALPKTWAWLNGVGAESAEVDMGIESPNDALPTVAQRLGSFDSTDMRLHGEDAPILLPAHVDALVQTSPTPQPDPSVELFLHGPDHGAPAVQVVWRADLDEDRPGTWEDIVKLCPSSSREAMPVQIYAFRRWFAGEKNTDDRESDLAFGMEEGEPEQKGKRNALVWRGENNRLITDPGDVRPGQTLVLPVSVEGCNDFGHIPDSTPRDAGDRAAFDVRRTVCLRLHPALIGEWPDAPIRKEILQSLNKADPSLKELEPLLLSYEHEMSTDAWPFPFLEELRKIHLCRRELNTYPEQTTTYILEARKCTERSKSEGPVLLAQHLADVENAVEKIAARLNHDEKEALKAAARTHDYGKVDVRYQAWLRGSNLMAAQYAPKPIAKSGTYPVGKQETVGLPKGFRHELLSLMFAERSTEVNGETRDLTLHLIASHHGRCRPFAPVVLDKRAECVSYGGISICKKERVEKAPYRLGSEVADRFWRLTKRYGWWGLAYLEALLRLADWSASERENAEVPE